MGDYCVDCIALIISSEFKTPLTCVEYFCNTRTEAVSVCVQASAGIFSHSFIALTFQHRLKGSFMGFCSLICESRAASLVSLRLMLGYVITVPPVKYFSTPQVTYVVDEASSDPFCLLQEHSCRNCCKKILKSNNFLTYICISCSMISLGLMALIFPYYVHDISPRFVTELMEVRFFFLLHFGVFLFFFFLLLFRPKLLPEEERRRENMAESGDTVSCPSSSQRRLLFSKNANF